MISLIFSVVIPLSLVYLNSSLCSLSRMLAFTAVSPSTASPVCTVKLLICDLSSFSMCTFAAVSFPVGGASTTHRKLQYVGISFLFFSRYFLISFVISSLVRWLFKSMLFNVHMFVNTLVFLLLVYSFIPLIAEKIFCMISVFNFIKVWGFVWGGCFCFLTVT